MALILAPAAGHAELFEDSPGVARYEWGFWHDMAAIEPAAGEDEGRQAPAPAEEAAHEAPPAETADGALVDVAEPQAAGGETPAEHEKTRRVVKKAPPPLPVVTIGGRPVITSAMQAAEDVSASTPMALKQRGMEEMLGHRVNIVAYAHSPVRGGPGGAQVVLFEDLSCGQCLGVMGEIDAALADYDGKLEVVHVHAPLGKFQDTNLAAFYGRIAHRLGKFWEFRAAIIASKTTAGDSLFELLLKTGVRERTVRQLMMTESRRFYRELDADATLTRSLAVGRPPVVFVNGIRVGPGGVPMEKLGDVLFYVTERIARGLPEPPQ